MWTKKSQKIFRKHMYNHNLTNMRIDSGFKEKSRRETYFFWNNSVKRKCFLFLEYDCTKIIGRKFVRERLFSRRMSMHVMRKGKRKKVKLEKKLKGRWKRKERNRGVTKGLQIYNFVFINFIVIYFISIILNKFNNNFVKHKSSIN